MKHLYLAVCCLCVGLISHAQFNKGQRMIGGMIYYNSSVNQSTNFYNNNASFGTQISYSKFLSPMSFYSIGLSYNYYGNNNNNQSNGYGLNYGYSQLQTLAKKFYLGISGSGSTSLNNSNIYNSLGTISSKTNGWAIEANGTVGLYYQWNKRFLLSTNLINLVTIRYSQNQRKTLDANNNLTNSDSDRNWSINTGLSGFSFNNLNVGIKYLLK